MKLALRLALLAVLGVLGWWLWTVLHPSPEKIIRKRLVALAQAASFTGRESLIKKGLKAQEVETFFAEQVEVAINIPKSEVHTISTRQDIRTAAQAALAAYGSLTVELLDPNVVLSPDKESAAVDATVRVKMPSEQDLVQELKFTLRKIKDEWLIIKIETVRTLS